jgi:hypothetical protein
MHSGDVLLKKVAAGEIVPESILVLQDMNSELGLQLIEMGAKAFYINCYESPLYAPKFYEKYLKYVKNFYVIDCYQPILNSQILLSSMEQRVVFPAYDINDLDITNHDRSRAIVIIASNKFLPFNFSMISWIKPKSLLKYAYELYKRARYEQYRYANTQSLNELRLRLMLFFSKHSKLCIYGPGWSAGKNIPKKYREDLSLMATSDYLGVCKNKIDVLRGYTFALCIENVRWPGYVTEKIIDCFVAGTIPIYFGAPDIEKLIPSDAYIHLDNFSNWNDLLDYIQNMSLEDITRIQKAGAEYLSLPASSRHSYQGQSHFMYKKILEFV